MVNHNHTRLNWSSLPFYPFLSGIYPLLYLWNANRAQEPAYVVIPPLLATLLTIGIAYLILGLALRSIHKAALAVFVISLFALTYGHLTFFMSAVQFHARYRPAIIGALVLALTVFLVTRKTSYTQLTRILNPVSALMILFVAIPAGYYYLFFTHKSVNTTIQAQAAVSAQAATVQTPANSTPPDVYFILMDAYSREDLFKTRFHFDDSAFINTLKSRGFVFPDCAMGNYPATAPVITSILNMDYLTHLDVPQDAVLNEDGSAQLAPYLQDNPAFKEFRSYGYKIVTFRGYLSLIDFQNKSDYYVNFAKDISYKQRAETLNFENLYLNTTLYSVFSQHLESIRKYVPAPLQQFLPPNMEQRFMNDYRQNAYAIDTLKKLPTLVQNPKFVYAHLYDSHWPYVMRPDGGLRLPFNEAVTDAGYMDGVQYLNNQIPEIIDQILAHSKTPPVIILQSDHSFPEGEGGNQWAGTKRLKIFSAYYLPDGGDKLLYRNITPVNNLRLVLSYYLKDNIPLLPDVSYYVRADTGKSAVAPLSCISDSK